MNTEHDEQVVREVFAQLPRATAPSNFEQETFVRLLLRQLPRATAPVNFEKEVIAQLRQEKRQRRWRPRLRLPRKWFGIAIGGGIALVGGALYYFLDRFQQSSQHNIETPPPAVLTVPIDSQLEQRIQPPAAMPTTRPPAVKPNSRTLESNAPSKRITPGPERQEDE